MREERGRGYTSVLISMPLRGTDPCGMSETIVWVNTDLVC